MIPSATYRIQLNVSFTFPDAAALAPYWRNLGVSHLYASPILKARAGSPHGYDVIDPAQVNPELGGESGLRSFVGALRAHGLGLIVDIVPNHMAVGGDDNLWWLDLLEQGQESRYAPFFDIDWNAEDETLRGKLLAPFLGKPYGEALAAGDIALVRDPRNGRPAARYFQHLFPIRSGCISGIERHGWSAYDPQSVEGRQRLHDLLEKQHYRLAWWRTANDAINWRRFFDVTGLAALRVEDDRVFEATHATLLRLYREGLIDGFRVDHVDGLTDPGAYCRRLRARLDELAPLRPPEAPPGPAWLVVEKILAHGEALPIDWRVDGTTGYDFMNEVSALLHAPSGEEEFGRLWASISGRPSDFEVEEEQARREILHRSFGAQLRALSRATHAFLSADPGRRDWTRAAAELVLIEILVGFRVYRTYENEPPDALRRAMERAKKKVRLADQPLVDLLGALLAGEELFDRPSVAGLRATFRQLSAPLAAKAVEDTAFYRYGRLLSRNDVGFDPGRFAATPQNFHRWAAQQARHYPHAMLATATHDHKRGEDIRARLAVLSEAPGLWGEALDGTLRSCAAWRSSEPSQGDRAMLFQMIVGGWPLDCDVADAAARRAFAERLVAWQCKALREAKIETSWEEPDAAYEQAAETFTRRLLSEEGREPLTILVELANRIGAAGAVNGLAQTMIKMTTPGAPDFFQGAEFWDLSFVDPDNRRAVDWTCRLNALAANDLISLAANWRSGRVKQALIARVLALRMASARLFNDGDYSPLPVEGPRSQHVVAFTRRLGRKACIVLAPRLVLGGLRNSLELLFREDFWDRSRVDVSSVSMGAMKNILSEEEVSPRTGTIDLGAAFRRFPGAIFVTS